MIGLRSSSADLPANCQRPALLPRVKSGARSAMTPRLKPHHANIPLVVSFEFPSHADARAFATLIEEQFGDKATVRKRNVPFTQGAFANWRGTKALRAALSGRSFTHEMLAEALANNGYAGTIASASGWMRRAIREGVIIRLERGVYEFCQPQCGPAHAAFDPLCLACQPEPLQCAAL